MRSFSHVRWLDTAMRAVLLYVQLLLTTVPLVSPETKRQLAALCFDKLKIASVCSLSADFNSAASPWLIVPSPFRCADVSGQSGRAVSVLHRSHHG